MIKLPNKQPLKQVGSYLIHLEKKLGEGQYGKVYTASDLNDETKQYAVKVIPSSVFQQSVANSEMLKKEIDVLKKVKHQNIVCLSEISQSSNNLYLFLDYCNGGDLSDYISQKELQRLSESEAVEFFKQIVSGYQYLYKQNIIHRDLKPENLMLHNGKIKVGDFGFGRFIEEGEMNLEKRMSIKCTPIYASPQLLNKCTYSSKCDVWSLGCVFYKILYGFYPFIAKDIPSLTANIQSKVVAQNFQFPNEPIVGDEVKQLIREMLRYEEKDRISWDDIFKHPLLLKEYKVLENGEDLQGNEKNNTIYQSIMKNRDHVNNDIITDIPQNFKIKTNLVEQKEEEQKKPSNGSPNNYNKMGSEKQISTPKVGTNNQIQTPITNPVQQEPNSEKHRQSLNNFQQLEILNMKITKADKMILFLRNQALFADVTMQLIFTSRNKYQLPNLLFYDIIYCLTGYYNFNLDLLKMMILKVVPIRIIKEDDFDVYLKSPNYEKTKAKIEKDSQTAQEFFSTLSKGILKEIQKQIQSDNSNNDLKEFEAFCVKQSANYNEYKNRFQGKVKQFFNLIKCENFLNNLNALRGIRGIQIFYKLDSYMPIQNYLNYDFRQFYDNQMNKLSAEQLLDKIKQEIII